MQNWLIATIVGVSLLAGWFATKGTKSQWIRLLDILVIGPLMIYAGLQIEQNWLAIPLMIFGATTITYNLRNFLNERGVDI